MAGHRRDDEHLRVGLAAARKGALEMDEVAEGPFPHNLLGHRHALAADEGRRQVEARLAVAPRRALEELGGGGHLLGHRQVGEGIDRVVQRQLGGIGHRPVGREHRMGGFIEVIEHAMPPKGGPAMASTGSGGIPGLPNGDASPAREVPGFAALPKFVTC